MKHLNIKVLSAVILGCSLSFAGCTDSLDITPTDRVSNQLIWSNSDYANLAVNDFYKNIGIYGSFDLGQSVDGLTEGFTETLKYGSMTNFTHMNRCNLFMYATTMTASWASYDLGDWSNLYVRIRLVNEAISNMKKYSSFDSQTTAHIEGQLHFFRGFLYFELVKRYKTVILYDENLDKIQNNTPLSTETEGWSMIENDLKFAGLNLPKEWADSEYGRVTKGAAYALLSRAMLYAEKWDVAKVAADSVIKLNKYELADNYADAFKTGANSGNKEAILEYDYNLNSPYHNFDDEFSPKGDPGVSQGGLGTPTQEMVESYELAAGGFPDWSKWHSTTGTTENPPYAQLEPRFQASVLYNGASWKGRSIEPFIGGTDGWCSYSDDPAPAGRTTTGYYLRKLVDESHDLSVNSKSTQPWISIRYAEVLLNYAEACYHTGDVEKANDAVKQIRTRVGLPYNAKTGDELMAAIRQERKVELSYEGLLFWDMRRWKLAHSAYEKSRVHGLKIEKNANGTFTYTYVDCDKQDRHFPEKLYRIPLPQGELDNNPSVKQYEEWR
ncbi:RagB/SusD family nutrient uptake outer membrane protein [uncultured Bacteroides sp.]|uniref:RagB/SusD family nutrient uptake outer membrane protein n=1 Tax=uncultured Bacteroides sp. TaxID=162156 RepID=UPI002AABE8EE|nr:RagB/SusD family nutrient uptake outer membrane protein [uncultured Bacteroides sp.]